MSSRFSIQKPYVIASLPQPIDHSNGRYVVGEVVSGGVGTKKRKRSELAVGIDGEGLSLYDISSSKLITSYALPPQSSFTCAPVSVRTRISKTTVERRSYASTATPQLQLTLFREIVTGTSTESSTTSHPLTSSSRPITYLGTITSAKAPEAEANIHDILAVQEDGEIHCFDGDSLQERWVSPASALVRDVARHTSERKVEFAHLTNAYAASQGILKGRQDLFAFYPQEVTDDGFNPDILVLITKSSGEVSSRTLHIVSLPRRAAVHMNGLQHSVDSLLVAEIPSAPADNLSGQTSFSLQVSTGVLQQFQNETLTTFDLSDTLPKEQTKLKTVGGTSFLRLSSTSVLVSSSQSVTVYNPKYQSTLATVELELAGNSDTRKRKREGTDENTMKNECKFIVYFPKLSVAVAIISNKLIGIQVEGHQDRQGRLRTAGLLIDSIRCSAKGQTRPAKIDNSASTKIDGITTLSNFLPSIIGDHVPWEDQIRDIESWFQKGECDTASFDTKLAPQLGVTLPAELRNGLTNGLDSAVEKKPDPASNNNTSANGRLAPADVDRRWILYALGKIFTIENGASESKLSATFEDSHTFMWLLEHGFMTAANIEAAIRKSNSTSKSLQPGQLVDLIVNIDPNMHLLLVLVAKNYLGAAELLYVIRNLMESLGLLGENPNTKQGLLANVEHLEVPNEDLEEQVEQLEAEIEQDLEMAEYQLGAGSGTRGHALSQALSKLYARPSLDIVHALQTTYSSQEIVCLIYLLRFELARGGWTTKYIDAAELDVGEDGEEATGYEDNAIILISSLLNTCVDAIGAGGWLSGEARLVDGDRFEAEELISSLKLEVSAALEGIEEAVYLKGLTSEMIKYGDAVESTLPKHKRTDILMASADEDISLLPVGLKVEKDIALNKVGAGGAVYKRTKRDIGYLKSQKVGKYSRERIRI
ncbi:uncharacterized protein PAC_06804 [Phialocephala subalpina]|uniref:Utp8 beta-propeller domain-containing protein n=1 Tax=Phialocephala subalpina TaxID=576137 RepID=A0A1L7WVW0_9HELO|nr:uncharacterized protein PAC_06804 [Phialocephala subalpina]